MASRWWKGKLGLPYVWCTCERERADAPTSRGAILMRVFAANAKPGGNYPQQDDGAHAGCNGGHYGGMTALAPIGTHACNGCRLLRLVGTRGRRKPVARHICGSKSCGNI